MTSNGTQVNVEDLLPSVKTVPAFSFSRVKELGDGNAAANAVKRPTRTINKSFMMSIIMSSVRIGINRLV